MTRLFFLLALALAPVLTKAQNPGAESLASRQMESIGVTLSLPSEWKMVEETEDGVVVFRNEGDSIVFSITMTPDVPGRTGMKASEYAAELLAFATEEGAKISRTTDGTMEVFRTTYSVDTDGDRTSITDLAAANDKSGTLYFVAWQVPESRASSLEPLRDAILSSVKFDPAR